MEKEIVSNAIEAITALLKIIEEELPDKYYRDEEVESARLILDSLEPRRVITISVEGGMVSQVTGIPDGWDHQIVDHDPEKHD